MAMTGLSRGAGRRHCRKWRHRARAQPAPLHPPGKRGCPAEFAFVRPRRVNAGCRSMSAPHSTRSLILANGGLLVMVTIAGAFFPILERMLLSWDVLSVTAARQLVGGIGLW